MPPKMKARDGSPASKRPRTEAGGPPSRSCLREDTNATDGPGSLVDLLDFPERAWSVLFEGPGMEDRLANLKDRIKKGLVLRSQYSGKGTAETAMHHIKSKIVKEGLTGGEPVPWDALSAFDSKEIAQRALLSHSEACRPRCIFGNMEVVLSQDASAMLDSLMPAKCQDNDEKRQAYKDMGKFLKADLVANLPTDQRAPCLVHGAGSAFTGPCSLWPEWVDPRDAGLQDRVEVWVAGQTCTDVSRRGKRQGWAGPQTRSYVVWVSMVRKKKPSIFIHEITNSQEAADQLHLDLGDLYDIDTQANLSPHVFGFPLTRMRQYSIGTLRGQVAWLGSWEEFVQLFSCRLALNGEVFFCAPAKHRVQVAQQFAKRQGWVFSGTDAPALHEILSPPELRRFTEYEKKFMEKGDSSGGFLCCDVDQEVQFGTAAPIIPCLISHGKLINMKTGDVATGLEHMVIMGAAA